MTTETFTSLETGSQPAFSSLQPITVVHKPLTPKYSPINLPVKENRKLALIMEQINNDIELQTMWRVANVNAVDRLGMSDHGRTHVQIVANIALKILRLLREGGVVPNLVQNYGMSDQDAEIVVVLGALLHDIGICVHRDEHEHHSLWLSDRKLIELLDGLYDIEGRTIMKSEILHAIVSHSREQRTLTIEAGVVKVADALDMSKGRSRIPLEAGHVNIHSISAAAIHSVTLGKGTEKPVLIQVNMRNSAGIYQIDELLRKKIHSSSIKNHVELVASVEGEAEERIIPIYRI
jgi:hypothetical protein